MKIKSIEFEITDERDWRAEIISYILFDNGKKLVSRHDKECCEMVYADFKNMQVMGERDKNYVDSDDLDFFENILDSIVPIKDLGFYLVSKQGICLLVSCYNIQNGYYSSDLTLEYGGKSKDVSQCVPDREYTEDKMKEKNRMAVKKLMKVKE